MKGRDVQDRAEEHDTEWRILHPHTLQAAGPAVRKKRCLTFFFLTFLFISETETEHEQGRSRERRGDTECEAGSRHRAVSTEPDVGLELTRCEIMTQAEVGRLTD